MKNHRWLTPFPVILALLLGILGTSAFFVLPDLIADKGAYETIVAYLEKDTLSMELEVDAQIGTDHFPITADIQRTSVNGEKVTSISQNEKTLYYAAGTVFMENGNAYKISNSLPDYSDLLEQAMELYRYTDVEAVDNTYSITANGEDAKALLSAGTGMGQRHDSLSRCVKETVMSAETKFTVFCMESYKVHKALTGKQVAQLFEKYGVYDYIREFYDVLHTTGYQ